jgi:hypothetical protein
MAEATNTGMAMESIVALDGIIAKAQITGDAITAIMGGAAKAILEVWMVNGGQEKLVIADSILDLILAYQEHTYPKEVLDADE